MTDFLTIQHNAESIRGRFGERDKIAQQMEDAFLMREDISAPEMDSIVVTRSPDNRQAVLTSRRLLSTNRPIINIPHDRTNAVQKERVERLEKFANALLSVSDHYSQKPLYFNVPQSLLLYDETHISIQLTSDIKASAKGQSPAIVERADRLAKSTPVIFKTLNPKQGYPVFDDYGLSQYVRVVKKTIRQIIADYGKKAEELLGTKYNLVNDELTELEVWEYWDLEYVARWIETISEPLTFKKHGLPCIPIVVMLGEGTDLFTKPDEQREPFLLTEIRSGLGARKSLMLTALYSKLKYLGFVPPLSWEHDEMTTERPAIKEDGFFQYIDAARGRITPLLIPLDPAFELGLNIAERKGEETTISKSATGQYLGAGTAFSTHALLSQLGRLPLETMRSQAGRAIAEALRLAMLMIKKKPPSPTVLVYDARSGPGISIDIKMLDDTFEYEVEMDVALPQDLQAQAGIFNALYGKVPGRLLFEKLLKMGRYEDAMEELMTEQAALAYHQTYVQSMVQQAQMMQQQAAQQAQMQQQMAAQQAQMQQQMEAKAMAEEQAMQQNPIQATQNMMAQPMRGVGLPPELAEQGMGNMEMPNFEEGAP